MIANFRDFIDNLIVENLHPELQNIVTSSGGYHSKQSQLAKKVKQLTSRGEHTGIEGNMPKGSSRAYLKHSEPHHIMLDGKPQAIHTGTKVAIRAALDKHHDKSQHEGMNLGALQNHAEGGDHWVNHNYRMLTHDDDHPGHFHSNHESGIFPPLIDHDHEHNAWTHVGHSRDIKPGEFRKITKTPEHPKGISHKDFTDSMDRFDHSHNGRYHKVSDKHDEHLDHVDTHPLIQKFQHYHGNTGNPTGDYHQKKNLGVFEHPDGSNHIVARDHGYNSEVAHAYQAARAKESNRHYEHHNW